MSIGLEITAEAGQSGLPRVVQNRMLTDPQQPRACRPAEERRPSVASETANQPRPAVSRVLVIDNHPLFREAIIQHLLADGAFDVVGADAAPADVLQMAAAARPDVVVLAVTTQGWGATPLAEAVSALAPAKVLLLSNGDDQQAIVHAFRCGVLGYLLKGTNAHELVEGIRLVAQGKRCVSRELVGQVLAWLARQNTVSLDQPVKNISFTIREEQVLNLLSIGMSNKQIAYELGLCEKTVKYYITHILKKLQVDNRVEAALFASRRAVAA